MLQLRPEGVTLAPPSPINEDSDRDGSRPSSASSNSSAGSAAALDGSRGARGGGVFGAGGGGGRGDGAVGEKGSRLPKTERLLMCTQVCVCVCTVFFFSP